MANPKHATLVASTVTSLSLDKDYSQVEICHRDGTAEIFVSINGATPTVGADGMHVLPAAIGRTIFPAPGGGTSGHTTVQLISTGTPKVSVRGL